MAFNYIYKNGDYQRGDRMCCVRAGYLLTLSGLCSIIVPSVFYSIINQGPESSECLKVTIPFYSEFLCKGTFDNKRQSFLCGDPSFFTNYPSKNEFGESCGNLIPACIGCNISDVCISHGYQCHAAIRGCAPIFTEVKPNRQLFPDTNISQCSVNSHLYTECTESISNDQNTLFPIPIVFGCVAIVAGLILTLSFRECCCGEIHSEEYDCCCQMHSCLCCMKYFSNFDACKYFARILCGPIADCFRTYFNLCYRKKPSVSNPEDESILAKKHEVIRGVPGGV
jgi:hypothetical protein